MVGIASLLVIIFVIITGFALLNNVLFAPMANAFNEQARNSALNTSNVRSGGVTLQDAANNTTLARVSTTSSKLFDNPVGFLLDFLNPLHFDSLSTAPTNATGVSQVNKVDFLTELGAKVLAIGGILVSLATGFITSSSGPPAAGVMTFLAGFFFRIASDVQGTFSNIPIVGNAFYVILIVALLSVSVFAILTLFAQSGA